MQSLVTTNGSGISFSFSASATLGAPRCRKQRRRFRDFLRLVHQLRCAPLYVVLVRFSSVFRFLAFCGEFDCPRWILRGSRVTWLKLLADWGWPAELTRLWIFKICPGIIFIIFYNNFWCFIECSKNCIVKRC